MLMVTDIGKIGKGKIREGTGSAVFHVEYTCLVFRPFKGEVLDAVVVSVNKARRVLFATTVHAACEQQQLHSCADGVFC